MANCRTDNTADNMTMTDNTVVTIRALIPGIDEVIPYTYDSKQYSFREYFNPIVEHIVNEAPSSERPKLVHMLGIPGAGKTTFYRNHKDEFKDYVLLDFDRVMEELPEYHHDREKLGRMEAFKKWEIPARIAGYETLRRAVSQKKNIYFDHGGTPLCHRELLINLKKFGYETTMYYIDCPVKTANERISNRERPFPFEQMKRRAEAIKEQEKVMRKIVDTFIEIDNGQLAV